MRAITIKIKGAEGVRQLAALGGKTKVLGAGIGKGTTVVVGKGLIAQAGEVEGTRLVVLGKGALAQAGASDGGRSLLVATKPGGALMLRGGEIDKLTILQNVSPVQAPATKAVGLAKAAPVAAPAIAKTVGAGAVKSGTVWSGTGMSLGLGVGMGALGPLLLVSALGLIATGAYVYMRSRRFDDYDENYVDA